MYKTVKKKRERENPKERLADFNKQDIQMVDIYVKGAQPHLCVCWGEECQLKSHGDLGVMEIMPIKNGQKM